MRRPDRKAKQWSFNMAAMNQFFEQMVWRPWTALLSSVEMLGKHAPEMMKIDAVISRVTHTLSRPILGKNSWLRSVHGQQFDDGPGIGDQ